MLSEQLRDSLLRERLMATLVGSFRISGRAFWRRSAYMA